MFCFASVATESWEEDFYSCLCSSVQSVGGLLVLLDLVVKFRVGRAERKSEGRRGRFRFVQHKIPLVSGLMFFLFCSF